MRSNDLFQRITRQIADAIAAGAPSFEMPWHNWAEGTAQPVNAFSGRRYRGINTILLWAAAEQAGYSSGRWATYRQWSEAGAQVRKGEKATLILFWKSAGAANDDCGDGDEPSAPGRARFISRAYAVFNEEQVDNVPEAKAVATLSAEERVTAAETYFANAGATLHHGGDRAFFRPSADEIRMPRFEQFRDAAGYYSTLAHEHVHWTGAKHRLDRDLKNRFGSEAYAFEELVAELGATFIVGQLGISVEPRPDHVAYISSWLKVLQADPRAILTAAAKAQQAVDYLDSLQAKDEAASAPNRSAELVLCA